MTLTPNQRSMRSRIAAHRLHATRNPRESTAAARAAFHDRFARAVDPAGVLSAEERHRRGEAARKAYFTQLALRSSRARSRMRGRA